VVAGVLMTHKVITINFPDEMTTSEFEKILNDNGLTYEDSSSKEENMLRNIETVKGKNTKVICNMDHVVMAYQINVPDPE
tara:strand:+ start:133 stop:372 length:240 start_codon:yes stop_codon:yes gene_type:complete